MDHNQQSSNWDDRNYNRNPVEQNKYTEKSSNKEFQFSNNKQINKEFGNMEITSGLGQQDEMINRMIVKLKRDLKALEDLLMKKEDEKE